MFNTFVGIKPSDSSRDPSQRRRSIVSKACVECRRRKTKCVGTQPCTGCLACKVECVFRNIDGEAESKAPNHCPTDSGIELTSNRSQKLLNSHLNNAPKDDYKAVVDLLFPITPIQSLKGLSREALLERAKAECDFSPVTSNGSSSVASPDIILGPRSLPDVETNSRLQKLQCRDSANVFEWDETCPWSRPCGEDDVNALALSQDRKSSFVGISSVAAAVRALASNIPIQIDEKPDFSRSALEKPVPIMATSPYSRISSYREEQRLIDAYFAEIHVFAPIIHEPSFRNKYLTSRDEDDRSWLALLNMVLALGSVASCPGDSTQDCEYYHRAQQNLSLESFGNGRLETLQALVLMGGQYLHYRNRPNMASAIIGACYRIAGGLGLHLRHEQDSTGPSGLQDEVNRRNWWTIYVLDTWGSVTLGRPSAAIGSVIDPPRNVLDDHRGELLPTEPTVLSPLIHNIDLCKIINHIHDRFLVHSVLDYDEICYFDNLLISWFKALPSFLRMPDPNAADLQDARLVLKWRYQNIRFLLYRPVLLDTVIRKVPFDSLTALEKLLVSKCREIAAESIVSIQTEWRPTKICCWNSLWFLFQACLIPLMALAVEPTESPGYQSWYHQVQLGIAVCDEMSQFSPVGSRTKNFLEKLFVAVIESTSSQSQYHINAEGQMSWDAIMGFLNGPAEWDHADGNTFFAQLDQAGASYIDDPVFLHSYQPY
ncbi:hypothetical protein N7468_001033 [Penicillium chermesinum]|uniref:Zn(2)-C6 fungal-type domain-containing protein n=1 Tax=Penicillium chermesinum TaxID=63820 RepID=A0A9W9PG12_9EURO|nr:uncharacterized protein N7468_001033 [Penicillium chermesinum]KAJ5246050.1 hypothetical protein N7468_001033 [Penicillium chermesinum]